MENLTGAVEAKSKKGNSILVDGEWYGTFSASDMSHVDRGDDVQFSWEFDRKTGKYRNIKGPIKTTTGGTKSSSSPPAKKKDFNLGVELGHASNLAMTVMLAANADHVAEIGGTDFYREWAEHTRKIKGVMDGLRAEYESGPPMVASTEPAKALDPKPKVEVAEEDLFD